MISTRVVNRTATFVFYIGERYFGVLLAYVPGEEAGHYRFTSALPVAILRLLAPQLNPYLHGVAPRTLVAASAGGSQHGTPIPTVKSARP